MSSSPKGIPRLTPWEEVNGLPVSPGEDAPPPGGFAPVPRRSAGHVFVEGDLGDVLDVGGEDGHHLARVLRVAPGEVVTVADGAGVWRAYLVNDVRAGAVTLGARGPSAVEPEYRPRLAVAVALTKGDKPEATITRLTELGVDRIVPVLSRRSVARPAAGTRPKLHDRWQRVARAASGQCRRARLPEVCELAPLDAVASHPALFLADPSGDEAPDLQRWLNGEVCVLVGPEGGLDEEELAALPIRHRLRLGPHVLRADTAAVAAAAVLASARRQARAEG